MIKLLYPGGSVKFDPSTSVVITKISSFRSRVQLFSAGQQTCEFTHEGGGEKFYEDLKANGADVGLRLGTSPD